jgi:hypothetical protein
MGRNTEIILRNLNFFNKHTGTVLFWSFYTHIRYSEGMLIS